MTLVEIIQFLLALIIAGGGYWLSRLANDVKELEKNIYQCQNNLPLNYVLRDDYHRDITEIKDMISEMYGIIRESSSKK